MTRGQVLLLLGLSGHPLQAQTALPPWISVDSAGKSLTLSLRAQAGGPEGIATLNGYHHGNAQLVVPAGWTVHWQWVNADTGQNHSLVLMAEREKLPLQGGQPALDNALSRAVVKGIPPGQKDVTTFVADQPGWYWLLCGVPGHALRGEWIGLKVDARATGPGVVAK
jgi:hypothetical protein